MEVIKICNKSTNIYLIRLKDGWLMVDAGWPGSFSGLLNLLKREDVDLHAIKYLIVTHFHPDHAGLVQDLKNSGILVLLLQNQMPYIKKINDYMRTKPEMHFKDICMENISIMSSMESRTFLNKLGFDGEMITTPGHSDDSITLIIDEDIAFTGDLPDPELSKGYNNPTIDESWGKIRKFGVKYIYPAHGEKYILKGLH
jgi:glyoxylase-like metal-dependent hydrolase (beta-lactamase superfamily II)